MMSAGGMPAPVHRPPALALEVGFGEWGQKEAAVKSNKWEGARSEPPLAPASASGAPPSGDRGRHTVRPRFCHNVCCGMYGKPNFDGQARGMVCHVRGCAQKLFRQQPSQSWQRLLEPEAGPALHTASWKQAPALPAPTAGSSYASGRKVAGGQPFGEQQAAAPHADFARPAGSESAIPAATDSQLEAPRRAGVGSEYSGRALDEPSTARSRGDARSEHANESSRPSTRASQRPGSAQSEYLESYLTHRGQESAKSSRRKSRSSSPHLANDSRKRLAASTSLTKRQALHMTDVCAPPQAPVMTKQHKFPVTEIKPSCSDSLQIYR